MSFSLYAGRTFAKYCLALSAGIVSGALLALISIYAAVASAVLVTAGATFFLVFKRRGFSLPAAFAAGALIFILFWTVFLLPVARSGGAREFYGCVTKNGESSLCVYACGGSIPPLTKLTVRFCETFTAEYDDFSPGEIYFFSAVIDEPEAYTEYYDGRFLTGELYDAQQSPVKLHVVGILCAVREKCNEMLGKHVVSSSSGETQLAKAMTLAQQDELGDEIKNAFRSTGLSHMLALSGLHFSIVSALVWWLLKLLPVSIHTRCAITAFVLTLYLLLIGSSPSVVRAAVFAYLFLLARAIRRPFDSLTALSAALALILIFNPCAIFSLSLELTFLAALGTLYSLSRSERVRRSRLLSASIPGKAAVWVSTVCSMSFYAVIFTLPVTVPVFESFCPFSPLTNLIAAIPCSLFLNLTMLTLVLSFLLPLAAPAVGFAAGIAGSVLIYIVKAAASLNFLTLEAGTPYAKASVCLLALSLVFAVFTTGEKSRKRARRFLYISSALLLCCCVVSTVLS